MHSVLIEPFERKHETLQRLLASEQAQNPGSSPPASKQKTEDIREPQSLTPTEAQRQARQAKRKERYEEVMRLHNQGMSQIAIATLIGLHRETIHRYIQAPECPHLVRPGRHKSKLDPYKAYLQQCWATGQQNVPCLIAEIREQGFRGGDTIVFDYLRTLRGEPAWMETYQQRKQQIAHGVPQKPLSARSAAWLFICNPRKLKGRQVWWQLGPLRQGDEELENAYQLAQDLRTMIVERQATVLARWCKEAEACGIPELCSLAAGIYRDYDAVYGALETAYSNGQTEAQVHRLKLIKRQAYGRASFELFRLRALHGSGVTHEEHLKQEQTSHQQCV